MNYSPVPLKYISMRTADSKVDPMTTAPSPVAVARLLVPDLPRAHARSRRGFQRPDVRPRVHHAVVRLRQVHVPKDRAGAGGSRTCAQQGAQEFDRAVVPGERHCREAGR